MRVSIHTIKITIKKYLIGVLSYQTKKSPWQMDHHGEYERNDIITKIRTGDIG